MATEKTAEVRLRILGDTAGGAEFPDMEISEAVAVSQFRLCVLGRYWMHT